MELSKKDKKELLEVYEIWWASYLNGDIKTYDHYLDSDFRFVGSTDGEEFLDKKATTSFLEATSDQLAGKAKLENLDRTITSQEGTVIITDLADAFILDDSAWVYYARFRFTSMLRKTPDGWRFFYQHFSTPDLMAKEGETLGVDKVTAENLKLRNAIKRRTAELELKNRELEIEGALQRIRAQATAMKQSIDLLDIVVTMRDEYTKLGHRADYFWHMMWLPDKYEKAMTSGDGSRIGNIMELPRDFHHRYDGVSEWESGENPFMILALETEEAVDYIDKMITLGKFQQVDPNAPTLDDIRHIQGITFVMARTSHGEIGYSLPGVVKNPPKEDLDILVRFAGAFDLAHRRFLDLQQSEIQAREVQIELGLEKVRSRAMAMQQSDELMDVASILFQQVKALGVSQWNCGFNIWEKGDKEFTYYPGSPDGKIIPFSCKIPLNEHPVFRRFEESKDRGEELLIYEKKGEEQKDHYDYMLSLPGVGDFLRTMMDADFELPSYQIDHVANFAYGNLIFITYEPVLEMHDVFIRFAKVFEQTYTRFLDLQKAEAQAKEAQIEAALERIRSKSMSMSSSKDIGDTVAILFDELVKIGHSKTARTGIGILDDSKYIKLWSAITDQDGKAVLRTGQFDMSLSSSNRKVKNAWKRGDKDYYFEMKGQELIEYYRDINESANYDLEVDLESLPPIEYRYQCFFKYGIFYAIDREDISGETKIIFNKFAQVFEQTYARFLDLKKAEAQAREARIETALERVRSRTMAMHNSTELAETAAVLFQQLKELGVDHDRTNIGIVDEENRKINFWLTTQKGNLVDKTFPASIDESNSLKTIYKGYKEKRKSIIVEQKGTELKRWISFITDKLGIPYTPPTRNEVRFQNVGYISQGMLIATSTKPLNEESVRILERFAAVFEQTYTRFLDLQKAEAQAREAQIEAALERVRARSMAMHKSEELLDVISVVSQQLQLLEFKFVHVSFVNNDDSQEYKFWTAAKGLSKPTRFTTPYTGIAVFNNLRAAIKKPLEFCADIIDKKEHGLWHEHLLKHGGNKVFSEEDNKFIMSRGMARSMAINPNIILIVANYASIPYSESDNKIIARFGQVFEQSYTRFLDLQKAEAQAREAQIEAALERVRSKTISMHNSSDVKDTVKTFFDEVLKLGIDKTIRCGIGILEGYKGMETWSINATEEGEVEMRMGILDMSIHPMLIGLKKAWNHGDKEYAYDYSEKDVIKYYTALNNEPKYPFNADLTKLPKREYHKSFFFSSGIIFTFTENPLTEESSAVLHRFAEVFGQTYRRYLDLRKAEAQAREAQIEAALEKVRSRTMAMQSSNELREAANLLFLEVQDLGINAWSAGYNILSKDKTTSVCWMSSEGELQDPFPLYYTEEASFIEMGEFLKGEEDFMVQELKGIDIKQHYGYMQSLPELKDTFQKLKEAELSLPEYQINHLCKFSKGYLLFITYEKVPEAHEVFKRFTKVFEQTYTRFLDLQKAENQSREAQVELALERVRASSMAMHKSEQLAETAEVLFEQFDLLGVIPDRMSIAIFDEDKKQIEFWSTKQSGAFFSHGHYASIEEATFLSKAFRAWKEGRETLQVDITGKELNDWVTYVKEEMQMELDESKFKGRRVQHCAFFSQGFLLLSSHLPISDETEQILIRFAKVFQQIYIRFLDHQKAEKLAREAVKRSSVDRVRAEIASMRTTSDLNRITPLIWNELTTLNVPFIRCGVFIMDEDKQEVHTHLSTPDGKALASFQLPYDDTKPLDQLLPYWRKNEMYTDHWDKQAFVESTRILMEKGAITSKETYLTKNQPNNLYLHFLPFLQGMLYVGSEVTLTEDELSLVQNLADAFSSAYARYEDFNKLELANKKIEKTLVDLRQAQSQLVQSEKMASLGELTAGIAHEIQNPLNFVNNFAEVSQELMQEMHEEIDNGELEEAAEISQDIEENLKKIHHHGQRASEIVKGMLQHSRSGSGVRELTNINVLADEYLRLAYHGLRAKDKSFNADFKLDIDENLPQIEIVPQDFGRVLLNLINNAFYAVDEKKKQVNGDFEPVVKLSTKKLKGGLEIKVTDNGNGIPQKVLDKIFQPFFTTKPTGKGTGLGLSLSYDIVQAHGGELKVETKDGEGTEFIIKLPV